MKAKKIGRNEPCPCGSGMKWKKCHGNPATPVQEQPSFEQFLNHFGLDHALRISDVLSELSQLTNELSEFNALQVISAAAMLASLADNHTLIYRIDTLIFLAASHCAGIQVPSTGDLHRWLNVQIPRSEVARFEDPPEDFAIGLVRTEDGDRLLFNGYLGGPDAYLQDVLDTLAAGPPPVARVRSNAHLALLISDQLVRRRGYDRFTAGSITPDLVAIPESNEELWRLVSTQTFTSEDLRSMAEGDVGLDPFTFTLDELRHSSLEEQVVGAREKFLLRLGDALLVLFPTAITEAVIAHTLKQVGELNAIRGFGSALNKRQAKRVFEGAVKHCGEENLVRRQDDLDRLPRVPGISDIAFHLDENKYLHLVIVHDDMRLVLSAGVGQTWTPATSLGTYLEQVAAALFERQGCAGVLTLVVVAGIGRAYRLAIPNTMQSRWMIQVWSLFDYESLRWLEPHWETMLWKLSQQKRTLSYRGIEFIAPDDATLYGQWMDDNYRLIPEEAIDSAPALVLVGSNRVFTIREKVRRHLDTHSEYRPDRKRWVEVCRVNPFSYFKEDEGRLRYGSPELAAMGILAGGVITNRRTWWIDCDPSRYPTADRTYLFKIWETAQIWLERVAPMVEEGMANLPEGNLIIQLDVSEIAAIVDWQMSAILSAPSVSAYPVHANDIGFTVLIPAAFVSLGYSPVNIAEVLLAKAFISGAAHMAGLETSDDRIADFLHRLNISPDERHMHTFVATDHRDHLREFAGDDVKLALDADVYFAGAEIAYEAGLTAPSTLTDRKECVLALNRLVDSYWHRCRERLVQINRLSIVLKCLRNNEAILAEQDNWRRTRRAVAAMHRDQAEVLRASHKVREEMDRTQISHRVMIEMAICTSPDGTGREATQEDVDYVGAQILQLIATAQESDAIRAEAIPSWIRVSLAGDVRLASDFSDLMRPYLFSHFELTHRRDIIAYERHFQEPKQGTKTEEEAFGQEFVDAFRDEYTISPIRLADVATVLAEDASKQRKNVVLRTRESLSALLLQQGFTKSECEGLLRHFVLPSRPDWTQVTAPFRQKEWFPWRYRRQLSLMGRPLVALNDRELVYAPAFCEDSFRHVVMEAYSGAFDTEYFRSRPMKRYIGHVNAKRGLDFNKEVAEVFRMSGWWANTEVQMTQLCCPENEASGDIDVIAVKDGVAYLCECKDLSFARTITEVVEQLGRFRGEHRDELWKHVRRVEWARKNSAEVERVLGKKLTNIRSLLVTSKIVPMQFATGFSAEVISVESLEQQLRGRYDDELDPVKSESGLPSKKGLK